MLKREIKHTEYKTTCNIISLERLPPPPTPPPTSLELKWMREKCVGRVVEYLRGEGEQKKSISHFNLFFSFISFDDSSAIIWKLAYSISEEKNIKNAWSEVWDKGL